MAINTTEVLVVLEPINYVELEGLGYKVFDVTRQSFKITHVIAKRVPYSN